MNSLPQIDFQRIRQHESSQQRAWEELAYLLVPDIARLPRSTELERRAAPDGGIEFVCDAPMGKGHGRWAWQAKFLFRLDASAFGQMTKSVHAALDTTPALTRYWFVLPIDRSGRDSSHRKSGMQKWNEHKTSWEATARARGMTVEFGYIGHSDVLAALQTQRHAGALRYFFDDTLLTDEFFRQQVSREIHNLGDRYDPAVHVDVEIGRHLDAVCRSPRFVQRVADAVGELGHRHVAKDVLASDAALSTAIEELREAVDGATEAGRSKLSRLRTPDATVLAELASAVPPVIDGITSAEVVVRDALDALPRPPAPAALPAGSSGRRRKRMSASNHPETGEVEAQRQALYNLESALWRLRAAAQDSIDLLTGDETRCAQQGGLLVHGEAGCGKSHLVADVAKDRVADGLPTLLVLGQHLTAGPIWPQILQSIGVDLTPSDFLQALEVAARLRGRGRVLIVVDAINEGAGAELWRDQLAGFLDDVAAHPWVAVVLTVRDTYMASVIPDSLAPGAIVQIFHPGLAGHEEEALARYSEHYGLRLPDVPPLLPELTNPLFLRTLCRSVKGRGLAAIPREASSLAWVFDGLISAVNGQLSRPRRLDVDPADNLVGRAVTALADTMLGADTEALPLATAKGICQALHPDMRHSKSLFDGLIAEGLLLREHVRSDHEGSREPGEQVRFTYQRLADHLRAEAFLERHPVDDDLKTAVLALAMGDHAWSRSGLIEALALLVPEKRGVELALLLRLGPRRTNPYGRPVRWSGREWLRDELGRAFLATLPWRDPRSMTEDTLQLARRYLRSGVISDYEWLSLLLSLACVPDHPLNIRFLDDVLRRMTMPERDESWSDDIRCIWSEDTNPIARTIDWAWSSPHPPPDDVAELAATLLAWLLSSNNRRLRDSATKSLLRLMERRTRLLAALLKAFADVDDPYITERLVAVACGHAVRHRHLEPNEEFLDAFAELGRRVFDLVFGSGHPTAHLLIRSYGRTGVEVIASTLVTHGRQFDRNLSLAQPPYGSAWPLKAPTMRQLARRYGREPTAYVTAATEMGYDFEHYVVERGIGSEFVLPNQRRRKAARRREAQRAIRRLRAQLLDELPTRKRAAVGRQLDAILATDATSLRLGFTWESMRATVPASVKSVLEELERALHRYSDERPVRPDVELFTRWISQRVLDLGWSPERFRERDRTIARFQISDRRDTERFAKKYMWIAFYELAGHLADHCQLQEDWPDSGPEPYEGPWQIHDGFDIDPTIVLRGDEPPEGTPATRLRKLRLANERENAWWLTGYDHTLREAGKDADWLNDVADIPSPQDLLSVVDPSGEEWVALESHVTWRVAAEDPRPYAQERRHLWVRTQASLIQASDQSRVSRWAAEQNWMGLWMPHPSEYLTGFVGGYPDLPPWPPMIGLVHDERRDQEELAGLEAGWEGAGRDYEDATASTRFALALATCDYHSATSGDRSDVDIPRAILPAPLVVELLGAHWAGARTGPAIDLGLGPVETEYSWLADGQVVAFASGGREFGSPMMLWVRAEPLRQAMASAGLILWSWVLGEKIYWTGGHPSSDRAEMFAAAALSPAVDVWGATVEHRGRDDVRRRLMIKRPPISA